jgi:hypothetical protein
MLYDPATPEGGERLERADMSSLRFTMRDRGRPGREHLYYVRVTQANGQQAWSSPIWVRYR